MPDGLHDRRYRNEQTESRMRGNRASPVREGADGNVLQGNAPAAYFTDVKVPVERM
jgi:hypothetical protein